MDKTKVTDPFEVEADTVWKLLRYFREHGAAFSNSKEAGDEIAAALRSTAERARAEALEEAAKVAEDEKHHLNDQATKGMQGVSASPMKNALYYVMKVEEAIRALASEAKEPKR